MKNTKSKSIAIININKVQYSIRATAHSLDRMAERGIDEYVVTGNILALGEKLQKLQKEQEEAIIIDEITNTSIVIGFNKNTIKVITVINKSNVWVKNNTTIINLK